MKLHSRVVVGGLSPYRNHPQNGLRLVGAMNLAVAKQVDASLIQWLSDMYSLRSGQLLEQRLDFA